MMMLFLLASQSVQTEQTVQPTHGLSSSLQFMAGSQQVSNVATIKSGAVGAALFRTFY